MTESAKRMRPTLLTIYRKGSQGSISSPLVSYACLSTNKHLYGRLIGTGNDIWPIYINLKRSWSTVNMSKYTQKNKRITHIREWIIEGDDIPPKFSKHFLEFEGNKDCTLEDVEENFKSDFYRHVTVTEDENV